jgi:dUTP pyrophosphatase
MERIRVNISKTHPEVVTPEYSREGDACLDLTAYTRKVESTYIEYGTGIKLQIPKGYVGLVYPRSSISNTNQLMANSVGVIDSNYTGEIKIRMKRDNELYKVTYGVGSRIAQIMIVPIPQIELNVVDSLEQTNRGEGGFGSSGV